MNAALTIRPATQADLPTIRALAEVIWRACYATILSAAQIDYMLAWMYSLAQLRQDLQEGVTYELLTLGPTPIGFVGYGPADAPGECKLHKIYLHPQHQRQGHGSRLLAHVMAAAKARGYHTLILNVNKHNASAIAAYRKAGFAVRESVVNDIGQDFVMDDYVMAVAL